MSARDESICDRCGARRVASMAAKTSDRWYGGMVGGREHDGYALADMGIGGGDYVCFAWCLECGKIQDDEREGVKFPLPPCKLEEP